LYGVKEVREARDESQVDDRNRRRREERRGEERRESRDRCRVSIAFGYIGRVVNLRKAENEAIKKTHDVAGSGCLL